MQLVVSGHDGVALLDVLLRRRVRGESAAVLDGDAATPGVGGAERGAVLRVPRGRRGVGGAGPRLRVPRHKRVDASELPRRVERTQATRSPR